MTVIRLIIRSALPLHSTTPAGKQEGRIRATRCAEIRRGRTSRRVECAHTHTHTHTLTHTHTEIKRVASHSDCTVCTQTCFLSQYLPHTHTHLYPLNPLSDHEQTNSTNSSRKPCIVDLIKKKSHGARTMRGEPRNNKGLRLQPRTQQ